MANRWLSQFRYSLEKAPTDIWLKAAIGATGAPTLSAVNSKGVRSIARNGAGDYTITFQDTWNKLLGVDFVFEVASGSAAAADVTVRTVAVTTIGTPTVRLVFYDFAGVAVDPASGETMRLCFTLSNSSAL